MLVADDLAVIRQTVAVALRRAGYKVVTTDSGTGALNIARERRPSAIVLDIEMPGRDGVSVLADLKSDPYLSRIPVLMLTGASDPETVRKAVAFGADQYLLKGSFSPPELLKRIEMIV